MPIREACDAESPNVWPTTLASGDGRGGGHPCRYWPAGGALFDRLEARHEERVDRFAAQTSPLLTVEPAWVEVSYVLPSRLRSGIARLAASGVPEVHGVGRSGYVRMAELFRNCADQDPDWADLALVWLAESSDIARVATFDIADFSVHRINGRKRFELELLR